MKRPPGTIRAQAAKQPMAHLSLSPKMVRPLFLFLADAWDPLGSTDIILNLRLIFSPGDYVILTS
jgi:hypothetical protein